MSEREDAEPKEVKTQALHAILGNKHDYDAVHANTLSMFSLLELLLVQRVCKRWTKVTSELVLPKRPHLNLVQFWSALGAGVDVSYFTSLMSRFPMARTISFAYCNNLTDDILKTLIEAGLKPSVRAQIDSLNLFYCHQLTDKSIELICKLMPNIETLDLGRCMSLTNASVVALTKLRKLRKLRLSYNTELTTDCLQDIETWEAIKELDVLYCSKLDEQHVEELKASRALTIIGPGKGKT